MMGSFAVIWEIGRKDLLLEIRNKDVVVAIAGFALLVLVIFTFAIDLNQSNAKLVGPGVLWAGIAFAGVTGLNRAFALEVEGNTLEALMLAPMSRDLIYLGKALGNFLFIAVAQILIYAGAVSILMVFAVMLTPMSSRDNANSLYAMPGVVLGLAVAMGVAFVANDVEWSVLADLDADRFPTTVGAVGDLLLGRYLLAFEVASILLLAALIGAIMLVQEDDA